MDRGVVGLLVDEVAAFAVATVAFLSEGVAAFSLVGPIVFHVHSQLFGAVSKLALLAVGAEALLCEVLAEGSLSFGAGGSQLRLEGRLVPILWTELVLVPFSRRLALHVKGVFGSA